MTQNDATDFTKDANEEVKRDPNLDWETKQDMEFAERGFITDEESEVKDEKGNLVWSNAAYDFEEGDAPPTVNPSLWRVAKLNNNHGLFKVTDGVYQVRGRSLSNITFIEGETGYIVIDPNISKEAAKNNLDLLYKHIGKKPVVAVIYSHSHVDHWGGVRGVVSEEDVNSGKTKIFASKGFLDYALSENLFAGNAMSRRAMYMYGSVPAKGPKGQVDCALGKATEGGEVTLIPPTDIIDEEGKKLSIDGVDVTFIFASGEAPTGMNVYFPKFSALHIADNCYHSLQNVYTIRGALTRDAIDWRNSILKVKRIKNIEYLIGGHNWPIFGQDNIENYLAKQSDALKYLHDQTLHLINKGYTDVEIANNIELPPSLAREWYLRGYYGSVKHCVRGIYSKYMGWYDANPCHLDPLPPRESGEKFLEFMGGADEVIKKAQQEYDAGDYRWVAQLLDYVVWAEPENKKAKNLAADALEQLGYQTENATWRNAYLSAAKELREGIKKTGAPSTASFDAVRATPIEDFFGYLGILLSGKKAYEKDIIVNWDFTDLKKKYIMNLSNAVLNYEEGEAPNPDASLILSRDTFDKLITKQAELKSLLEAGKIKLEGDNKKLQELFSLFETPDPLFPIATHEEKK